MESVNIDRPAYEHLLAIAKRSDPCPRWGVLGGTYGVVRSAYLNGDDGDRPERIDVLPDEAQALRNHVESADEDLMGYFYCQRGVSDDGRTLLPARMSSGWLLTLMGDSALPWIGISVDLSPAIALATPSPWKKEPVTARVISRVNPLLLEKANLVVLDGNSEFTDVADASLRQVDRNHDDLVATSPGEVSLGRDIASGVLVRLGEMERRQGLYVIGKTGMGKTTLLESLIVQDMEAGHGVCVLDPHGDLIDTVLARVPPDRESDVILLDLADSQHPFGLNLFECQDLGDRNLVGRVATHAVEVFEKLWGDISWGPQLAQVLRNCAYTLIENQGYTMTEIRRLLLHEQFRAQLTSKVSNPQVREFWELEYAPLRDREQQQLVRSTLNKVDEFLTPTIFPIVGFGRSTVNFRHVMDGAHILLVRLGLGDVGASAVSLIGSMIVGQLFNAALSRRDLAQAERRQFNLYADEYHRFATPAFADLLAEARKYALATTLAHQFRGQLSDEPNRGATLNAANLVVFAVHGEDGEELAKQFDRTPPPADVVGQRPKLIVCQEPVAHLVRVGHEDAWVTVLLDMLHLREWVQLAADGPKDIQSGIVADDSVQRDPNYGNMISEHQYYTTSRPDLVTGLRLIDLYLVKLMQRPQSSNIDGFLFPRIINKVRGVIGFARDYQSNTNSTRALLEYWQFIAAHPEDKEGIEVKFKKLLSAREQAWVRSNERLTPPERANQEVTRMMSFVASLRDLGARLARGPILVDSGQWEPIYDRPRTYSDIEAEIASTLVSLPKYQARCRFLEGKRMVEHTVQTPEFRAGTVNRETEEMIHRIQERSRANHCAPLEDVLLAIRKRQLGDDGESGTYRRVRLTE